jgi:hypothetical protein
MKLFLAIPLAVCVYSTLFFSGIVFYAMAFKGGIVSLDFNSYNEGWIEFSFSLVFTLSGVGSLIYLFNNWRKERSLNLEKHGLTVVIVLCILSFLAATGVLVFYLLITRS